MDNYPGRQHALTVAFVQSVKRKCDGSTKGPWRGEFVGEFNGWAVVLYAPPPAFQATDAGLRPAYGLRYHGMERPLSIIVYFDAAGGLLEYFCDAAFPATRSGDTFEFVDLDIDLVVAPDFSAMTRDWDDFATNCAAMRYSAEAVQAAFEGIELAKSLVARRAMPFDGHPQRLIDTYIRGRR